MLKMIGVCDGRMEGGWVDFGDVWWFLGGRVMIHGGWWCALLGVGVVEGGGKKMGCGDGGRKLHDHIRSKKAP